MTRIGVLGLGNMGSVIADRLLSAGFALWVHNRTPERARGLIERGATWADSGDELADHVDLLITMVADDGALLAVTTGPRGILCRPHPGVVYADMSTVSPDTSVTVADAAAAVDVLHLRAPVSGSTALAQAGRLGILSSGPQAAHEAFDRVFSAIGKSVFYLGTGDESRFMKLALNMLVAQTVVGLSEALVFGESCGLEWQAMLDVFADSAVSSPLVQYKAATLAARDFDAAFTTEMMVKDLEVAMRAAKPTGAVTPTTALNHQLLKAVCGLGWADQDFSSAVVLFEQLSGRHPAAGVADH